MEIVKNRPNFTLHPTFVQSYSITNGLVYSIWASPYDPERYLEAVGNLDRIWQTVTDSLRFFSPVW
jgi:hypothetical protein